MLFKKILSRVWCFPGADRMLGGVLFLLSAVFFHVAHDDILAGIAGLAWLISWTWAGYILLCELHPRHR
jgi:hypothetical protein